MVGKPQRRAPFPGLAWLLLLLLAAAVSGQGREEKLLRQYGQEIKRRASALDSVKSELEKGRALLEQLRRKEQSSTAQLQQVERTISLGQEYLQRLGRAIDSMGAAVDKLEGVLAAERERLRQRQEKMEQRLAAMYKVGRLTPMEVLLDAGSPTELLRRVVYFRRLRDYDAHLVRAIDSSRIRIQAHKTALEQERAARQALRSEREAQQERLQAERQSREQLLKGVQAEKQAHLARLGDLEASQKQLALLLQQLQSRKASATADLRRSLSAKFEKRKGKLAWPVSGALTGRYGKVVHPVYQTVTMNNGIDIGARPGESVRCVGVGVVAYIGRMRGLGRFVVVDHCGGYLTIYGNLGAIAVTQDEPVEHATVVGTASAAGGGADGASVHFEVRRETQPLDPLEWLERK